MATLRTRLEKLEGKLMSESTYEALLNKHATEDKHHSLGLDKQLLIDTVIALLVKDCREHKLWSNARGFLAWASTTELKLIERAYNLIDGQIDAGLATIRPLPLDVSSLDASNTRPPYAWFCKVEQLADCPNKPFWLPVT